MLDPAVQQLIRDVQDLTDRVGRLERALAIPVFAQLADAGAAGRTGRVIFVKADGKLYRDTGSAWKSSDQA